jgi:ATP-dependent HslUV protease ATP-binding subunit HslU
MTINTRNILFVALGAFTKVKPEDLITEVILIVIKIQGRFPNKVRVNPLTKSDFKQILLHSKNSVIDQAIKLIKIEGLNVEFTECSLDKICEIAANLNIKEEDVGARRLISIVDHILQDISFDAPEIYNENKIEGKYVK